MPMAIAVPVRRVALRRWQHGQTISEIAAALDLAPRTLRRLIRRFRQEGVDPDALLPQYSRCGWHRLWTNPQLYVQALEMRRRHLEWGAGLIRVFLAEDWPDEPLPHERTLQRWFAKAGLSPAPRGRHPLVHRNQASKPHEVWEMDAVEHLHLQDAKQASWLRITDEFSGAVLHTKVFSQGHWSKVGAAAVQSELRQAFRRWGRPERLRVDNGVPWGSKGDLPTPLSLWVMGLDVAMSWNHPYQPRENPVVERSQGVSQRWVEPQTCADASELQHRLDQMDRIQRERYPSIRGRSRLQAYPGLAHSQRPYSVAWEARHWSVKRVWERVSEYAIMRRVDRSGCVWLYDQSHTVGKRWIGQDVFVTLDPESCEWLIQDAQGRDLRRQPARQLTETRIRRLRVGRPSSG